MLEEAQYKFEIWTDHKNLEYFMKAQKLNRRQARWALYLSWFDFILKHVAGSKMGKADGLSVVATTRHSRTNDLTTSKALQWDIK